MMEGTGDRTQAVMIASQKNNDCCQNTQTRRTLQTVAQQATYIQNFAQPESGKNPFKFSMDHHWHDSDQ
jgi:hypothetical protein